MEIQWPLVLFTLFVCWTCGILGAMAIMALKGKGKQIYLPALICSAVSLVVGGLAVFTHLQHWERIFNGFGHITSGITHELIGCVLLAIVMVWWFVTLRKESEVGKGLIYTTLVVALAMVIATAHSYYMPARPAWGLDLIVFYLGSACLLGGVTVWVLAALKGTTEDGASGANLTFYGAICQLIGMVVFLGASFAATPRSYGYYLDDTTLTTPVKEAVNLGQMAVAGDGAVLCWCAVICAVVALALALMAKKNPANAKTLAIVALAVTLIASVCFRVLFYIMGGSVFFLF